jgi:hypothetical protein
MNQTHITLTDAEAMHHVNQYDEPLRQTLARKLWWLNVDRHSMPKTFAACMTDGRCQQFAYRDQLINALVKIGYSTERAGFFAVNDTNVNEAKKNSMRRLRERRKLLNEKT